MEKLKSFSEILKPDFRSTIWVNVNQKTGEQSERNLRDHYDYIAQFKLCDTVPDEVKSHFATAQNLYLYTWFCYDFFPVAEQKVLTSLEFALRERIGEERLKGLPYKKRCLAGYIQYSINHSWIRQCDFKAFENRPLTNIQDLYVSREQERAHKRNQKLERSDMNVPNYFNENETLTLLLWLVAGFRNIHSHGSNLLHHTIGFNFLVVMEFINTIYSERVTDLLKSDGGI